MKLHISKPLQALGHVPADPIKGTVRSVADLVYPPRCVLCHQEPRETRQPLCPDCKNAIDAERGRPSCPTCAASVARYEVSGGRCSECRRRPVRVLGSVRVGHYRGCLGYLVRAYKYGRREELEPVLGGWLLEAVEAAPWRDRIEAIVPVPTHWRRRIARPVYPAERLASFIAGRTGLPHVSILRRVRAGPRQIGLSYTARVKNVHGAFAVRSGVSLDNARLLIIDDVKTTGATIDECARVLRCAGASELYAATVVKAGWLHTLGGPLSSI